MTELLAIVSSFNRAPLLEEALASLVARLPQHSAIIVIDAGSNDGSQEIVRQVATRAPFPVHLMEERGISFAAGVNLAVQHGLATLAEAKTILLFETDNVLRDSAPILAARSLLASEPRLGAVGFTVRKHDGTPAGFGCSHPTLKSFILGAQLAYWLRLDRPHLRWREAQDGFTTAWAECDVVYTSPLLIQRRAWEITQGFATDAFPFSDCDLDWAQRLKAAGYTQAVLKTSAVVHDNQRASSPWSAQRALHFHKSRFELLRREHGRWAGAIIPVLALRHLGELAASLINIRARGRYFAGIRQRWKLLTGSFRCYR